MEVGKEEYDITGRREGQLCQGHAGWCPPVALLRTVWGQDGRWQSSKE